jgi:cytochrome P450
MRQGDMVILQYTIHHNEQRYPDPFAFNVESFPSLPGKHSNQPYFQPDRYLNDHTTSAESAHLANVMERDHWTFGAG